MIVRSFLRGIAPTKRLPKLYFLGFHFNIKGLRCPILSLCSYGPAYTMPVTPRGTYQPGGMTNKSRSLRGGVVRNGNSVVGKGVSLPGYVRTSSTLPRMSARQLQQPIPHNVPSFLRPNSTVNFPSPVTPVSSQLISQGQSFQPTSLIPSTTSFINVPPPPLPPRSCDVNEMYMDDLCKRVTDHVLPDGKLNQHNFDDRV